MRAHMHLFVVLALAAAILSFACEPTANDWQRKDAAKYCGSAIDDYPKLAAPSCEAMHMCANEAVLIPAQKAKLQTMIRAATGCADP